METEDGSAPLNARRRALHDEVVKWALERAWERGWKEIKVDLESENANGLSRPEPIGEDGRGRVPDLTGYEDGQSRVVEVKTPGAFAYEGAKAQLGALSEYAKREGGRLTLFVPHDAADEARAFLAQNPTDLDLYVSDREYRHEMNLDYPDYGSSGE